PSSHDDRTFGAKRAAGTDGNRRRHGFQQSDAGTDLAPAAHDGLDRLRHSVPTDRLGTISRHEADYEAAHHRRADDQPPRMHARSRRDEASGDPLVENQI